jgi:hypothetical protein
MAQQITIDIVAETKKLREGVSVANEQLGSVDKQLKGLTATAFAAASAFVLQKGTTFLKQGIDEAREAAETMRNAITTFGEGSSALQKITTDADNFGKAIAVDNDEIVALATQLGARLPENVRFLSAELVNVAFDVEAFTAGAISAEAVVSKLGKAFIDGKVTVKELATIFPDLTQKTYLQAEALVKQGDTQTALNLLIREAQKAYGDAAEKNVTSTQKFDTALANLKETIGTKILPFVEKAINFFIDLLDAFSKQPKAIQNIELGFLAIVAIGAPLLTFIANLKIALTLLIPIKAATATASTAMATGMTAVATTTGAATVALTALKFALVSTGIGALIVGLGFLAQKFLESKSASDQLDGSINKNSASYRALTGEINNASGALNQYRLFATQGANNLLNTKAFENSLGGIDLSGGGKKSGGGSSPEIIGGVNLQEIVDKLIKVQDKITDITFLELTGGASKKTIDAQLKTALQEFDILTKQAERFGQTITQGDNRTNAEDARNYSITINTLQPSAEVGKAVVQAIGAFAERGGNTGSFLDKFR